MKEENWALPVMQTLILDLRNFARRGDKRSSGKPGERQEKAAETMMSAFRVCVADTRAKTDDTKRWGMLFVVNQLFKVNIHQIEGKCSFLLGQKYKLSDKNIMRISEKNS